MIRVGSASPTSCGVSRGIGTDVRGAGEGWGLPTRLGRCSTGRMRRGAAFILAAAAIGLSGCTSATDHAVPAPTAQPAPSPGPVSLSCVNGMGANLRALGMQPVLGVVALPISPQSAALGTGRLGDSALPRLFAKSALVVRSGSSFRLQASPDSPSGLAFSWNPHETGEPSPTRSLVVSHCRASSSSRWLAFIGGYYIDRASCVSLTVSTSTGTRRVKLGVGAPCRGQRPPVGPSQR
jgi:hypothetical protein